MENYRYKGYMIAYSPRFNGYSPEIKVALKFLAFLLLLALGMGISIYIKQSEYLSSVAAWDVISWQVFIWLPMFVCLPVLNRIEANRKKSTPLRQGLMVAGGALAVILLHFGWFFLISKHFSPYLGYPKTKFGVYPFFFIFWITIDFMIVGAVAIYLYMKRTVNTNPVQLPVPKTLAVRQGNRKVLLNLNEIIWIAAENYYIRVHTGKGDFLDRIPLKEILGRLPESLFLRVHRSAAVNISAVSEFRPISGYKAELLMSDGTTCPVSSTYLKPLKAKLASSSI